MVVRIQTFLFRKFQPPRVDGVWGLALPMWRYLARIHDNTIEELPNGYVDSVTDSTKRCFTGLYTFVYYESGQAASTNWRGVAE